MSTMKSPTLAPRNDGELLAEFAARRHEPAFAELVRRHGGMVLSVCRSVVGNTPDAEDAAQAVFLTLAKKAGNSTVQTHLVGWLHRVAWYVAARAAEARAVRRRHEQEAARMRPELRPPDDSPVPLDALHAGLNDLPETYRVPLILHHVEGRSQKETAALLGCSPEAVAVRLHRGRELLRKRLRRVSTTAAAVVLTGVWGPPAAAAVPAAFVDTATRLAAATHAGAVASTTLATGPTLALSQSAVNMLFWTKVKTVAAVVLLVGSVAGVGAWAATRSAPSPAIEPPAAQIAPPEPGPGGFRTGVITQIGGDFVGIQPRLGDVVVVAFTAATTVALNDRPATTADLKVGMGAAVYFEKGKPATHIRANSP